MIEFSDFLHQIRGSAIALQNELNKSPELSEVKLIGDDGNTLTKEQIAKNMDGHIDDIIDVIKEAEKPVLDKIRSFI